MRNSLFSCFCCNNEKLNSTGCNKFSNQLTNLKLCIRTDIRWYSLRIVTYLRYQHHLSRSHGIIEQRLENADHLQTFLKLFSGEFRIFNFGFWEYSNRFANHLGVPFRSNINSQRFNIYETLKNNNPFPSKTM